MYCKKEAEVEVARGRSGRSGGGRGVEVGEVEVAGGRGGRSGGGRGGS